MCGVHGIHKIIVYLMVKPLTGILLCKVFFSLHGDGWLVYPLAFLAYSFSQWCICLGTCISCGCWSWKGDVEFGGSRAEMMEGLWKWILHYEAWLRTPKILSYTYWCAYTVPILIGYLWVRTQNIYKKNEYLI